MGQDHLMAITHQLTHQGKPDIIPEMKVSSHPGSAEIGPQGTIPTPIRRVRFCKEKRWKLKYFDEFLTKRFLEKIFR